MHFFVDLSSSQHYGAWSPPVGTPNPNAAGVAAAAPAPAPASGAAAAGSEAQDIHDSSVRKVSNLPAWMTKQ
jgi:3-oxoacyl-ACP reductase-like protein